ncbi:hypothetical protein [Helicobacter mustelae]|uniref:Putative cell division protein n=1 Tax=Helicobacter mustelae (strain ATCC 43772 / CCUG 25715 / CIP 103759 / LMG 18044 / NCTC 12198 / R85-136P) TaxID=679897 RepID=D3UGM8_HELM1|nr:hypothetical protein [Helicobacter mustelae]CBG39649.1 putative cell division protein [Helicobacter mustelae 12198]SQH71160.1 cell division protein [Helicobacter mustelae]
MNFLKRHLVLILPLVALLFSLQSILLINRAIQIKENKLNQSYSILIASKTQLTLGDARNIYPKIEGIKVLNIDFLLQRFKDFNDAQNLALIAQDLPYFYSLKLGSFPDQNTLEQMQKAFSKIPTISKIETFSKTHNQVYELLFFIKKLIYVFATLLALFSLSLMMRQVQIWRLEHQERMYIMELLGAQGWLKHKYLFQLAFFDSLIASCIIFLGSFYASLNPRVKEFLQILGIKENVFYLAQDFFYLTLLTIGISMLSVFFVIVLQKGYKQ